MTTEKQVEANRENGKLGGVKTEEGKSISKLNALRHGLLSREVLLRGEDEEILVDLSKRIRGELKPAGELELLLADRIVSNVWRLKRLLKVETTTMEWFKQAEKSSMHFDDSEEQIERKSIRDMLANDEIEKLLRYETSIERSIYKALHELQRIQAARNGEKPALPIAVDIDVNPDTIPKE